MFVIKKFIYYSANGSNLTIIQAITTKSILNKAQKTSLTKNGHLN